MLIVFVHLLWLKHPLYLKVVVGVTLVNLFLYWKFLWVPVSIKNFSPSCNRYSLVLGQSLSPFPFLQSDNACSD